MYWWNVQALAGDLKDSRVAQKDQFKYLIVFMIAGLIGEFSVNNGLKPTTDIDELLFTSVFLITIFGLFLCYRSNQAGDDKDFILRVICLGFPVTIRVAAVWFPVFFAVGLIESFVLRDVTKTASYGQTNMLEVMMVVVYVASFYGYLIKVIRKLAKS